MLEKILVKEVVAPIIIIIVSFILYKISNKITKKIFKLKVRGVDRKQNQTIAGLINNIIKYIIIIIATLMILDVYNVDTKALIASLGVMSFVVGLAFQDIIKDFVAGVSIILENQYRVGDTIEVNGFRGEVLSLGMKTTRIKAYTGEIKIIANHLITEVINYSLDETRALVDVSVAYGSDLDKVEKVLTELCKELSKNIKELNGPVELLGLEKLDDSSVVYRLTANTTPMTHFDVQRQIRRAVKDAFDQNNIEIPYPQVVIHNEQ